jgi:hypothetical protein
MPVPRAAGERLAGEHRMEFEADAEVVGDRLQRHVHRAAIRCYPGGSGEGADVDQLNDLEKDRADVVVEVLDPAAAGVRVQEGRSLRVRPVGEAAEEVERLAVVRMPAAGEERGAPGGERGATLQPTVYTAEFTWARRAVERSTTAERR